MEKSILLFIYFVSACITYSQDADINLEWRNSGDVVFGAYIGLTTSTITDNDFGGNDNVSGNSFLVGAQADYFFKNNWSLKAKLNYENRDFGAGGTNYLNVTVAPVWHFGTNRRWHLQLGAAYSAPINDSLTDGSFETDFGIGVIIPIDALRFFIEIDGVTNNNAFEVTLTDINGNPLGSAKLRTNRTSINFGILF